MHFFFHTFHLQIVDMELLVHLYKQMILETNKPVGTVGLENCELSRRIMATKEDQKGKMEKKLLQPRRRQKKSMESGSSKTPPCSDKKLNIGSRIEGSYIVGGSVSGLNFITFASGKPVYYGVKRESYRSCHNQSVSIEI